MPEEIKTKRLTAEKPRAQKRLFLAGLLLILVMFAYGVRFSIRWCEYTNFFNLVKIEVSGVSILSVGDVKKIAGVKPGIDLLRLDIHQVQKRLEKEPYIEAALVSREYPNRLKIMIKERIPVCYLNSGSLWLIDQKGVILPLPKERLKTNLPIITGFEADSARCRAGQPAPNPQMLTALDLMKTAALKTSALYADISEIYAWKNDEFIIYTVNGGTPIYLGRGDLIKQLFILANFQSVIHQKRNFADYQYIDLRWDKQIIAKERSS